MNEPTYRGDRPRDGVVVALAEKLVPADWTVGHAVQWNRVRMYRAGDHAGAEARKVLALALDTRERRLDALLFTRDADGDSTRVADLFDGVQKAAETFPAVAIAGGVPSQTLENWLLALRGERNTERLHRQQAKARVEAEADDFVAMVEWVRSADPARLAPDAASLHEWIGRLQVIAGGSTAH